MSKTPEKRNGSGCEVRVRIGRATRTLHVVELPEEYIAWSFGRRIEDLCAWRAGRMPALAGPHCAAVASHGGREAGSVFTINNAVKGIGWLPRAEHLQEMINELEHTRRDALPEKLNRLEAWYRNGAERFDCRRQCSLELFTHGGRETQTYRNMMADPRVSLVFLDMAHSFELHCIAQVVSPDDQSNGAYEQQVLRYANAVHDYIHGSDGSAKLAVIYHVVGVYDNSPGSGRGRRLVR